jgi:putative endopeptidase
LLAAVATPALADQQGRCLDELCTKTSLSSLDAIMGLSGDDKGAGDIIVQDYGTWGFDLKGMDTSVAPGDNFFNYANGVGIEKMVIPADRTGYGSFTTLADVVQHRLQDIINELSAGSDLKGDEAKIAILYRDMMDQKGRDALDIAPIYGNIVAIRNIKSKSEMARYMGHTAADFGSSIFGAYIGEDDKNPQYNALTMFQGGLSLPDRDYYLEAKFAEKKAKYQAYVAKTLGMINYEKPEETAAQIVAFETAIAKVSWTRIESRDPDKTYNPMTWAELKAFAPGFDWMAYANASGLKPANKIIVAQKSAFAAISKVYADTPLETIKAWQTYKTVSEASPYLSERFTTARWTFFAHDLNGALEQAPLWKRAVNTTEGIMGEALGKSYVERYFPASSKTAMVALVENLRVALSARIQGLTWMSDTTKEKALKKLSSVGVKVGYPDKWRDYSALDIKSGDLIGNIRRSSRFEWDYSLSKLNQKVDPTEWGMTPQTVNAYYSPTRNEIVFPAAILQAPFFDPKADDAINYGGIGGVIGHEFTHGFDDQGRKYSYDGSLSDWWGEEDGKKFEAQTVKLGAQYDTYEPLPGAKVQGGLTMGENIADMGGILVGLDAYRLSLKGTDAPVLDGFSGDQRVFLGWAQVWRVKMRDDAMRSLVVSDPHSPAIFRVIGPTRNIDDWYQAFGVKDGDKYYLKPEDRVKIW